MRLFVLARHGESVLNIERRVNGDPRVGVPLTPLGESQAGSLGEQLANLPLDVCVHTTFGRSHATAHLAIGGRGVPFLEQSLLDDVKIGDLEGRTIEQYREWKSRHTRSDRFPNGESLDEAALRYAAGFEWVLRLPHQSVLVVTHEIPVRYAVNAGAGSSTLDGPVHEIRNCTPYLFDEGALGRAVTRMRELSQPLESSRP
jgi:broad specificity phosphatase PhoE